MSQCDRLLALLRRGPRSHHEIHELAGHMIVNSRVAELRSRGHNISCTREGDLYVYSLLEEGDPERLSATAVDDASTSPVSRAGFVAEPASPSSSGDAHPAGASAVAPALPSPTDSDPGHPHVPGQMSLLELVA